MKRLVLILVFLLCAGTAWAGTGYIILPVQAAKITGAFVTDGDATQGAQIDAAEGAWRLLFDAATDECGCWMIQMPGDYNGTTLTAKRFFTTRTIRQ